MNGVRAAVPLLLVATFVQAQEQIATCPDVPHRQLVWADTAGQEQPLPFAAQAFTSARLSPDSSRVAVTIFECDEASGDAREDIWVLDLTSRSQIRLTFGDGPNEIPVWTPDGGHIAFRSGLGSVAWTAADGTGQIEDLTTGLLGLGQGHFPSAFSPDGTVLFFSRRRAPTTDAYMLSLVEERRVTPLLTSEYFNESQLALSPNRRWLAYASNESGSAGIYVRPFPDVDGESRRISSGIGIEPVWSLDGRQLFYRAGDLLVSVDIDPESGMALSQPRAVITGYFSSMAYLPSYSIAPGGQRFLIIKGER